MYRPTNAIVPVRCLLGIHLFVYFALHDYFNFCPMPLNRIFYIPSIQKDILRIRYYTLHFMFSQIIPTVTYYITQNCITFVLATNRYALSNVTGLLSHYLLTFIIICQILHYNIFAVTMF